jgi:KDO2-lipid IV(A) lauroyltransferase
MKFFTYYLLYIPAVIFAALPYRVLYAISDLFYFIVYYLVRYRKKTVFENLSNSFPEKSNKEITTIAKKFYRHFCDLFVESLKMLHFTEKKIDKHFRIKNPEIIEQLYADQNLIMAAMAHYNNWEWVSMLTRPGLNIVSIYKTLHNENFDRFILKLRTKRGSILLPTNQTLRFINNWKNSEDRAFFCFVTDQSPMKKDIHYWTKFLNQSTPIFVGIEKIAIKMDRPVCYFRVKKLKRGYYEMEIVPITQKPSQCRPFEITEAHVRLLEEDIIKNPEFWLWSHRRWKRKPDIMKEINTESNA